MIEAERVSFAYDGRLVLDGVAVSAHPGKVVGLIGPNGSGKTTLLRTLFAVLKPKAGLIAVDGEPIDSLNPRQLARRLSVVAQEGGGDLPLTAAEMVLLGRTPHLRTLQRLGPDDYRVAGEALARVGMRELAGRTFAGLSGGERQRVLIARALAQQADHLLLDEPTNHLDIRYQHEVLMLVRSLGVSTVVVLHDLNLAGRYCDELVLLDQGRVRSAGPPEVVLTPKILEPVYRIGVSRLTADGFVQLLFALERQGERQGAPPA